MAAPSGARSASAATSSSLQGPMPACARPSEDHVNYKGLNADGERKCAMQLIA